jgi:ubiquinone/menaquinone biosynthesis C-methylase UbiE
MNGYDHIARLYDLEHCDFSDDIELFLNMARLVDKPGHPATGDRVSILEVGCGTGRVTLALAEAGCDVVGIDRSGQSRACSPGTA